MSEKTDLSPPNKHIKTLFSLGTEFSADSVEWCPIEPSQNFFVCANYQLSENEDQNSPAKRLGKILLFSVSHIDSLTLEQTIETDAVLDQKWCHCKINNNPILGVVNANRTLEIYKLNNNKLEKLTHYQFEDTNSDHLILSLDWSTGKFTSETPQIVCSDSKGDIHIFKFSNNDLILEKSFHGHDYEAWIAGFYYWDTNIFFSGGDDSTFLMFDQRTGDLPVSKNKRHDAGVTSFHSNKSQEFLVANGSYDENVRLWDIRSLKNATNVVKMPGTLWRLKWDPICQNFLLAACMLGGVHIIDVRNKDDLKIFDSYYEHKNISYGADWSYLNRNEVSKFQSDSNVMLGTCSFYDRLLCVSTLNCNYIEN